MSRHANAGRKLSRNSSHRKALLDNLVRAVILSESIRTTTPKAKEARRLVERVITKARQNTLAARRVVHKTVRDQAALARLFETIGPRFKERPGGYTRIIHVENRVGDNAEPEKKADKPEKAEKKAAAKETSDTSGDKNKKSKKKKAEEEKKR